MGATRTPQTPTTSPLSPRDRSYAISRLGLERLTRRVGAFGFHRPVDNEMMNSCVHDCFVPDEHKLVAVQVATAHLVGEGSRAFRREDDAAGSFAIDAF